jgi:hypothetical protein
MNILLGDLNDRVIKEPTTGNEGLHEIKNDNGIGVINFAASKNFTIKSTMSICSNIHKLMIDRRLETAFNCTSCQSLQGSRL